MVSANKQNTDKPKKKAPSTAFKPGQSGNPKGRPKISEDFRDRCRNFMSEKGWANLEKMANDPLDHSHFRANELIAAYAYGKPSQKLEHTGEEGGPLVIKLEGELEEWAK